MTVRTATRLAWSLAILAISLALAGLVFGP
jgi:hypothetical protein